MSQENVKEGQEQAKESQEQASVLESTSDFNYKQDMMKYKTQRNEARVELESIKAQKEEERVKKLEEDGKLKELLSEKNAQIEKMTSKADNQGAIVEKYKTSLINSITSDEERKEYLSTKEVDFLEELKKEKGVLTQNEVIVAVDSSRPSARESRDVSYAEYQKQGRVDRDKNWNQFVKSQS